MHLSSRFDPGRALTALLLLAAASAPLTAQPPLLEKAELRLVADRTAYPPGGEGRVAAVMSVEPGWHVNSHAPTYDYLIPTTVTFAPPAGWSEVTVDYPPGELRTFAFEDQPLSVYEGRVALVGTFTVPADTPPGPAALAATLRYQACDDHRCLPPVTTAASLAITVGNDGASAHDEIFAAAAPGPPAARPATEGRSLALVLLLGVVGGLILNAMPCVLPVLSLKVFGLVKAAGQGTSSVVAGALATAAGILVSFWALAGAAVLAQIAGAAVGWGVQFQEPTFVTFLTVVVVLFCLNLWGLFEILLPASLARVASTGPRQGIPGHFASGLFATLMATPCSAPFLGTAVGFALSQSAAVVFAVFTAVGLGMSLPYLALAAAPRTASLLPKPGAWMERLKVIMGFLLAGAAVWLLYVLSAQVSAERLAAIELALLVLALFVWLRQRGFEKPLGRRLAAVGILATALGALWLAAGAGGADSGRSASAPAAVAGLIAWSPFDRHQAESLAAEGRLVFVDVTADWCFTCKVNERLVLETPEVAEAFARHGVVAMKADWTNRDDAIGAYLAEYGRYGIPFYLLYRPVDAPHLFSELLTKGEILSVLDGSAGAATPSSPPRQGG